MIKRIKKILTLILIGLSVNIMAQISIFNVYTKAEVNDNSLMSLYAKNNNIALDNIQKEALETVEASMISIKLNKIYSNTDENYIVSKFEKYSNISYSLDDISANNIAKILKNNMSEIQDEVTSVYNIGSYLISVGQTDKGRRLQEAALTVENELKNINSFTNSELTELIKIEAKNIPVYKYSITNEGNTIGQGFIIGGLLGLVFNTIDTYLNITSKVSNTIDNITNGIDRLSDSLDDFVDSIKDKSDDVDNAWDKVLDRFDNDEGWKTHDDYKYYYDKNGVSLKGVHKIDDKTYYFNRIDGAMETGWQIVDGKKCYFDKKKGYELFNQWVKDEDDWYYVGEDGAVKKMEWINYDGKYYYLKADGKMTKDWFKVDEYWYYFNEDGSMVTSTWKQSNGKWYYLKDNGEAANDWLNLGSKWYYFKYPSGEMQKGWFRANGNWYYANEDGSITIQL